MWAKSFKVVEAAFTRCQFYGPILISITTTILTNTGNEPLCTGVLEILTDISRAGIAIESNDIGDESGNMWSGLLNGQRVLH